MHKLRNRGRWIFLCLLIIVVSVPIYGQEATDEPDVYLNINAEPQYETLSLNPDFEAPYIIAGIAIEEGIFEGDVVNLNNYQGDLNNHGSCAGFTTVEPTQKIEWRSTSNENILVFSFESEDDSADPIMFIHIQDFTNNGYGNWCSDDFDGELDPLITINNLSGASWIYIWVGSYHPSATVSGNLNIFRSLGDIPGILPTPIMTFGSIQSSTQRLGKLDIELYCLEEMPNYPIARHLRNIDVTWACWSNSGEAFELSLTDVCLWEFGDGSYVVQEGSDFNSYACYRRTDSAPNNSSTPPPEKEDYSDWNGADEGGE